MATVRDLIADSLKTIGVLAGGEVPTAQDQTDCFNMLNRMLDSFSNEELLVFSIVRETFNLVAGQQTYTFGPGGNFNSPRPQDIQNALIVSPGSSPVAELPLQILSENEYASIILKTITSSLPQFLYLDDAYPLANISLWTVPSVATSIVLYSWKPMTKFATVGDTVSLPPGYELMLIYNLAIYIAPMFGKAVDPTIVALAVDTRAKIKRMNIEDSYLGVDQALVSNKGAFNWLTGDTV